MKFARGDIVLAAQKGDYGKARPCLVIQSDHFGDLYSVTFCMLTTDMSVHSDLLRITINPTPENGLREPSQICVDKIGTLPTHKIAKKIGNAGEATMTQVTRALMTFLAIA